MFLALVVAATRASAQPFDEGGSELTPDPALGGRLDASADGDAAQTGLGELALGTGEVEPCPAETDPSACDATELQRIAAAGPSLAGVQRAARRAAGLAGNPVGSWQTRSRWSALVPVISVRVGNGASWRDIVDTTVSYSTGWDVRAGWRLERLVFDANEPRLAMVDVARRRERRHVDLLAQRAYFAWLQSRAAAARDERWLIQAQRATAELDALTDGWFSQAARNAARRGAASPAQRR